jgi:hypothetical protein
LKRFLATQGGIVAEKFKRDERAHWEGELGIRQGQHSIIPDTLMDSPQANDVLKVEFSLS